MGKSARRARASSFVSALTAMSPSYPRPDSLPERPVPFDGVKLRLLLLLLVALLAGCGGGDGDGDGTEGGAGAKVFAEAGCGSCHTFSPAGSNGTVGPNLDETGTSFDRAVQQITNGGGGM